MDEFEYRVGPGSGEWVPYSTLTKILSAWSQMPQGYGAPAITITKRVKEDDRGRELAQRLRRILAAEEADRLD